jgi:predicted  nucleic acid-binding Zn-ribbon protein
VAVATLVPAAAGPVDEAIAAVRVQIAEVEEAIVGVASTIVRVKEAIVGVEAAIVGAESAISGLEAAIVAEGDRIVAYHGDLEAVDVAIAEIEARIVTQDEGMLVYPVRLELLADEYIEVWASRAGPFRLRRELAVDSYVRNDERMNSVLTQSAQLTDKALEGIRSRILYDALIQETDERLEIVDARMRIAGDRVAGVHTEISLAKDRQAASFRELEDTRASIEVVDAKIAASGSEIERFHGEIERLHGEIKQQRGDIERLRGEIVLHQEEIVRLEGEIVRLEGEIELIQELPPTRWWSGLPGDEIRRPALAVKIDNVSVARPQEGINQADVVYEELVEAGLTRLIAVFQTTGARSVGPIRSARTSDPILLEGFDRPLFAYSGANRGTRGAVAASELTDVGYDAASSLYWRSTSRRAPHNLFSATDRLWGKYPERDEIPTSPFAFRTVLDGLHPSAEPVAGVFVDFGNAEIDYAWNGEGWERTHNGDAHSDSDGVRVAPPNVVIQFTTYSTSSADSRSPEAETVGSGEAWVFTDGHVVRGRWERPDQSRPAALVANGRPIRLTPGRTWVALARAGTAEIR